MIKLSAGTAHLLGFKKLVTDIMPTTAYMMSGVKCIQNCGFCPQARNSSSRADLLSRVSWCDAEEERVLEGLKTAYSNGQVKRACLQVVDGKDVIARTRETVRAIRKASEIPICVSAKVRTIEDVSALAQTGADRITISLDAAGEQVYNLVKTGSWNETLNLIGQAAKILPGRISTHLIVGLGETEQQMVNMMQYMHDLGVTVALFAFTPIPGTGMSKVNPPRIDCYRRMQVANYLMGLINVANCRFKSGRLISFGIGKGELREHLKDGKAFETSGCPDCNRPYYNEKPGGCMYNYPRPLTAEETEEAINLVIDTTE
ncbi:MAG: radical SAM protein [Firmicutes bacterium HGW-Firmicutes-14]|jgi:biotin synthase|nr:MAG: radical SAM protein [Firmicutes bacterium HGW-Firmicutes-14]